MRWQWRFSVAEKGGHDAAMGRRHHAVGRQIITDGDGDTLN
jgi:hypothetical protein